MADKIVRASDASLFKRIGKKYFNQQYLADMTDAEMQKFLDKPKSVFDDIKRRSAVEFERVSRGSLLNKAYKDQILRGESKKDRNKNLTVQMMVKAAKQLKKELDLRKREGAN